MNVTANQDWSDKFEQNNYNVQNRTAWGQKASVNHQWDPLAGPFVQADGRQALNVYTPYNMTRLPFRCQQSGPFTRLPEVCDFALCCIACI